MAFLTLNGIEIPVAGEGARLTYERLGESKRAQGGQDRTTYRAQKREWEFTTTPQPLPEAKALKALIAGLGVHISCDGGPNSDNGLVPYASTATGGGPGSLLNHGTFINTDGFAGKVFWQLQKAEAWTVIASAYLSHVNENHVWRRVLRRSDGAIWQGGQTSSVAPRNDAFDLRTINYNPIDGVLALQPKIAGGTAWAASTAKTVGQVVTGTAGTAGYANAANYGYECTVAGTTGASAPAWPSTTGTTVVDGSVTWRSLGEKFGYCGDLAWLPYSVPDSWAPQIFEFHKLNPWSALPRLTAGGSFAPSPLTVLGEVEGSEFIQVGSQLFESFSFKIREV